MTRGIGGGGEGEFTCKNIGSMNATMWRTNVQLCTVKSGNQIATTSCHMMVFSVLPLTGLVILAEFFVFHASLQGWVVTS